MAEASLTDVDLRASSGDTALAVLSMFWIALRFVRMDAEQWTDAQRGTRSHHKQARTISEAMPGGREFEENEYPWTVILLRGQRLRCSGVQISPRHILTATHCVLIYNEKVRSDLCAINRPQSIVSVLMEPQEVSVLIGGKKIYCDNFTCQHNKALYGAKKITVKEMNMCDFDNDLAIIELSQNVSENDSTAICSPKMACN
ncbi:unnamed protein product [Cylicocyclus nassatus]|uniref:Peptidase S1 domain-containing protein n=1 Tax=Cylicocyclus nassatus TaxID=53992 RepID=A0AA36HFP1_CYLNA|nr:unnamed protein product [Cylicocyclus nassatus]